MACERGKGVLMSDDESAPGTGMRAMFWMLMTIIGGGLLVMIVLPLLERWS